MTAWVACGAALAACVIWPGLVLLRARLAAALVAMEMAGVLASLALFALSLGFGQPSFVDLSLTVALLGVPGTLVFAYFVERWL
jgi:multisubunit Na+/H+ antiporter MnhF subunit